MIQEIIEGIIEMIRAIITAIVTLLGKAANIYMIAVVIGSVVLYLLTKSESLLLQGFVAAITPWQIGGASIACVLIIAAYLQWKNGNS